MIQINLDEPNSPNWKKWCQKCQKEQKALNDSYTQGKPKSVSDKLYKGQKDFYLGLHGPFHGKCAYCETLIAENHPGDLDHYRPKKSVTNSLNRVTIKDCSGGEEPHPGYYWLAYDFRNLLPTCEDCNRPNKSKTGGRRIGKWDEFPVRGFRASKPGEENREEPLLLNPTAGVDIEKHLVSDGSGIFACLTQEAETTCGIFGLNIREALIKRRFDAYREGSNAIIQYLLSCHFDNYEDAAYHLAIIKGYIEGIKPYSAAGRAGIKAKMSNLCLPIKELLALIDSLI